MLKWSTLLIINQTVFSGVIMKDSKLIKCIRIQIQNEFNLTGIQSKAVLLSYESKYLDANPKTFAN